MGRIGGGNVPRQPKVQPKHVPNPALLLPNTPQGMNGDFQSKTLTPAVPGIPDQLHAPLRSATYMSIGPTSIAERDPGIMEQPI